MPLTDNHEHGAFLISRSLFESDIWAKPPHCAKLWIYLIGRANHKEAKYRGYTLKRGQCFVTVAELTEQIRYEKGFTLQRVSESRVKHFLKFLRDTGRITSTKEPRGMVITIVNYDLYQRFEHYGRTKERSGDRTKSEPQVNEKPLSINNKVKNEKNKNYNEKRKGLVRHLQKTCPDIQNPDAYITKLERLTSPKAVEKALNDWNIGSIHNKTQLWERAHYHHTKLQEKKESTPSPSADADN